MKSCHLDTRADKLAGQYFSAVLRVGNVSVFNSFQPSPLNSVGGPREAGGPLCFKKGKRSEILTNVGQASAEIAKIIAKIGEFCLNNRKQSSNSVTSIC